MALSNGCDTQALFNFLLLFSNIVNMPGCAKYNYRSDDPKLSISYSGSMLKVEAWHPTFKCQYSELPNTNVMHNCQTMEIYLLKCNNMDFYNALQEIKATNKIHVKLLD